LDFLEEKGEEEINAAAVMTYSRILQLYKCGTMNIEEMRKIMDPEYEIEKLEGKDQEEKDQIKEASNGMRGADLMAWL
jgi:hypothetical protein